MPIAAGLAGGVALSSFGAVSRLRGVGHARRRGATAGAALATRRSSGHGRRRRVAPERGHTPPGAPPERQDLMRSRRCWLHRRVWRSRVARSVSSALRRATRAHQLRVSRGAPRLRIRSAAGHAPHERRARSRAICRRRVAGTPIASRRRVAARAAPGRWRRPAGSARLASGAGAALLMPLKRVEPFVVRVDNSTGVVDVVPVYAGARRSSRP